MPTSAARNHLCGSGVLVLKTQQTAVRMCWWYILRPRVLTATSSPYTSQYQHSHWAILMLCPGPLHKTHCCTSSVSFFSRPQSLLPVPQPTHLACALPLSYLSVSFLMKNFLWLITLHNNVSLRVSQAILMSPLMLIKILRNQREIKDFMEKPFGKHCTL